MNLKYLIIALFLVSTALAYNVDVLNTDPSPLEAGSYADITLRLSVYQDTDEPLYNASLTIEDNNYVKVISEEQPIYKLMRGDTFSRTIRVYLSEGMPSGYIDLPVLLKTKTNEIRINKRIYITDSNTAADLYIGKVTSTPDQILPDTKRNTLKVSLQNLGDNEAELLTAELVPEFGVTPSVTNGLIDSVARLNGGNETTLEFSIDVAENIRENIPTVLKLHFRSKQGVDSVYKTYDVSLPLEIEVTEAPFLEVVSVEQLDSFSTGSDGNVVRLIVKNSGSEDAEDVRVRLFPDISFPFLFEQTTQYISAKMEPGANASVEFKTEITKDATPQNYDVSVELESMVSESRYSRQDSIRLEVSKGAKFSNKTIGFIILINIFVISAIIVYLRRRNN